MIVKGESAPRLWIVAGPNGCGKSTIYARSDVAEFDGSVWIVNPDLLTKRLQVDGKLDLGTANLEAVKRIEAWLDASIDVHQTIGVETVLSTSKYRRLVTKARERHFDVRFIYIYVDSLELQLERIRLRVAKGGHDVPAEKVAARRDRSFAELPWFFWRSNQAWIFDNSGAEPKIVARKETERHATISGSLIPAMRHGIANFRAGA